MSTRKRYTKEFKLEAVRLLEQGDRTAAELARELGVRRNQLYKWQQVLQSKGEGAAFRGPGRKVRLWGQVSHCNMPNNWGQTTVSAKGW